MMRLRVGPKRESGFGLARMCVSLLLLLCASMTQATTKVETQETPLLVLRQPVQREIASGQAHNYRINLTRGEFLHLVVTQNDVSIFARLYAPDDKLLVESYGVWGTLDEEQVSAIAETEGVYRLEVSIFSRTPVTANYQINVEELHMATPRDGTRVEAESLFREAIAPLLYSSSNEQAIAKYERALSLFAELNDLKAQGLTLLYLGLEYRYQRALTGAPDTLHQALLMMHAAHYLRGETMALRHMGHVFYQMGEYQNALEYETQALTMARSLNDRYQQAYTLNNLGLICMRLGETAQALNYFQQVLPLFQEIRDLRGQAYALSATGTTYNSLDNAAQGIDYCQRALKLMREIGDTYGQGSVLFDLSNIYDAAGDKQKALDCLTQSLALFEEIRERHSQATVLSKTGAVYYALGDEPKALEYYQRALPMLRALKDRNGEALTLYRLGQLMRGRGELEQARALLENAIEVSEDIRTRIAGQDQRAAFFATVRDYYRLYVDVLMQLHRAHAEQGFDKLAWQTSERARARSLLELLNSSRTGVREGVAPDLLTRERELRLRLNAVSERQLRLLNGATPTNEQQAALEKEANALVAEYQLLQAQIQGRSPRYAALTQPAISSVQDVQQHVLDDETILLEYLLGQEHSYLWVLTRDSLTAYELPPRAQINDAARSAYEYFASQSRMGLKAGANVVAPDSVQELSRILLGPAAHQLGHKRLLIVADGILQYIPFAALPEPNSNERDAMPREKTRDAWQPLMLRHEIVGLPSVSALAALREETASRAIAPKSVVVIADPVFVSSDSRVRASGRKSSTPSHDSNSFNLTTPLTRSLRSVVGERGQLGRLINSRAEADSIIANAPARTSRRFLDFAANRRAALSDELAEYRIVHFATHGILNEEHPELSGIVLSLVNEDGREQDGFLGLSEIYNMKLSAELVVLSACRSGLGREVDGEGLIGLTRGFMYAGAERVVASLWFVDDKATAELMKRMYSKMLKQKMRPSAALRSAQQEMWESTQWQQPFYWAGFTLQGEWR